METSPLPPALLGVHNRSGLTLCLLLSIDVECCHKNCFCMLSSLARIHCGSLKTATVNSTAGSMIAFSSIILTATLVERLAAMASRFLTFRILKAQLASTRSSVLAWYPKYLVVCLWRSIGMSSNSNRATTVLRKISSLFAGCTNSQESFPKRRTIDSTTGICPAWCKKLAESSTKAENICSWIERPGCRSPRI